MNTQIVAFPDLGEGFCSDDATIALARALSSGGDARITLDPKSGLNRYHSAPYPRRTMAYASSTANDLSPDAFRHLLALQDAGYAEYAVWLDQLRSRIRRAYRLADDIEIVFAPSGTDLEYIALAAVQGYGEGGVHNILLGADEVGSGCIHSAHGRYFASETALGEKVEPGQEVDGFGPISLADVPVRCAMGIARTSTEISETIAQEILLGQLQRRHALIHVVHGSKTGLILPELDDIDRLTMRYGNAASFVIDACQARITTDALQAYLERDAIVFLTGSKFMGGAPFSGFALMHRSRIEQAAPLPRGFSRIFRRAEIPATWSGQSDLVDTANLSLALRLESAVFELERFQAIAMERVRRIIAQFVEAVKDEIVDPLGIATVAPLACRADAMAADRPVEMQTLVTLNLGGMPELVTFDDAQRKHAEMALSGLRLGQPVKCVRANGAWGATMRVGMSMPQFSALNSLSEQDAEHKLRSDMRHIAHTLTQDTAEQKQHSQND